MEQLIIGIITTAVGIAAIVFRKKFVDEVIKLNNEGYGFMHYGERERKIFLWQTPLLGSLFILWGILTLLGVVG